MSGRLSDIQQEHREWSERNFGEQPAWTTLLGMGEEYGEAMEHTTDRAAFLDAVGDFSIFLLHYLRIKNWDATYLWAASFEVLPESGRPWPVLLGRLMHHELKKHQNIRGTAAEHAESAKLCVAQLFAYLRHHCAQMGADYLDVVEGTWKKVRERDWMKARCAHPREKWYVARGMTFCGLCQNNVTHP